MAHPTRPFLANLKMSGCSKAGGSIHLGRARLSVRAVASGASRGSDVGGGRGSGVGAGAGAGSGEAGGRLLMSGWTVGGCAGAALVHCAGLPSGTRVGARAAGGGWEMARR